MVVRNAIAGDSRAVWAADNQSPGLARIDPATNRVVQRIALDADPFAIALGYGSLYNRSWDPNARYDHDHDADVVSYSAVRRIERGEEITINYTGDPTGRTALWFDTPSPT